MITKKELNKIFYLNKELKMWKEEKERVGYGLRSPATDNERVSNSSSNAAEELAQIRIEISEHIDNTLNDIQKQRLKTYKLISRITDSRLRQIVNYRCVSLCSWSEVAGCIGWPETADTVRKYYSRAFNKNGELKEEFYN